MMKTARKNKRQDAYRRGLRAESFAALYLQMKGYRILRRRYKTPVGEIDLIAQKKKMLVIVEVKTRRTRREALESITHRGQIRIEKAALYFLMHHPDFTDYTLRFDVMAGAPPFCWQHLDNAWQARS